VHASVSTWCRTIGETTQQRRCTVLGPATAHCGSMPSRRAIPRSTPARPLHAHAPPTLSAAVAAADAKSKITRASLMSFKAEPRGMRCAMAGGTSHNRPSPPFDLRDDRNSKVPTYLTNTQYMRFRPGGFCCWGGCWRRARGVKTRERLLEIQPVRTPRCYAVDEEPAGPLLVAERGAGQPGRVRVGTDAAGKYCTAALHARACADAATNRRRCSRATCATACACVLPPPPSRKMAGGLYSFGRRRLDRIRSVAYAQI
jgi:hypothetical protein